MVSKKSRSCSTQCQRPSSASASERAAARASFLMNLRPGLGTHFSSGHNAERPVRPAKRCAAAPAHVLTIWAGDQLVELLLALRPLSHPLDLAQVQHLARSSL